MKYMLVLFYAAGLTTGQTATAIGPYDDWESCRAAKKLVEVDHWKGYCYPVGKLFIEDKKED